MSDGFDVDTPVVAAHAARVGGHAGHLRTVAGAARPLGMDAFGMVGQIFAGSAVEAAREAAVAVRGLSDVAAWYATSLHAAAEAYRVADEDAMRSLRGPA